jgi:hypothetical protein
MFVSILAVIAVITRVDQRAAFMSAFGWVLLITCKVFADDQYCLCHLVRYWTTIRWSLYGKSQLEMVLLDQSPIRRYRCCR